LAHSSGRREKTCESESFLVEGIRAAVAVLPWENGEASGADKKNHTERLSRDFSTIIAGHLRRAGLGGVKAPGGGPDKSFMGGYGPKGVDVYLSDEKHGLLLTSGVKGLLFDPGKNLKNRYRDMVMEALELHKRFPYAVCGHFFFVGRTESSRSSKKFGTVLGEAVALLQNISDRRRPDESPELYEALGIMVVDPGDPASVDLAPTAVPEGLWAATYCERLVDIFHHRNPFF